MATPTKTSLENIELGVPVLFLGLHHFPHARGCSLTHFLHIKIQAKLTNFTFYLISPQVFTAAAVCKAIPHLKDKNKFALKKFKFSPPESHNSSQKTSQIIEFA